MKTDALQQRLSRYANGGAVPTEIRQIQTWLSVTDTPVEELSAEQRSVLEMEILSEIQAYTAYPLFHPKKQPWWSRFTAMF